MRFIDRDVNILNLRQSFDYHLLFNHPVHPQKSQGFRNNETLL